MRYEYEPQPTSIQEAFAFTDQEQQHYQVDDERFQAILRANETTIHHAAVEQRGYGEFLFITLSRQGQAVIFYSLGEHHYRRRWYTRRWFWSPVQLPSTTDMHRQSKTEVITMIHQRKRAIAKQVGAFRASKEAVLSTLLADFSNPPLATGQQTEILNLLDDLACDG